MPQMYKKDRPEKHQVTLPQSLWAKIRGYLSDEKGIVQKGAYQDFFYHVVGSYFLAKERRENGNRERDERVRRAQEEDSAH